ncbi:MAG TPA: site-2 protease family protein [Anaerolineales bacterium]|nr:site-2 protease family protein [Anaerolineales bacterium]
MAVASITPEWVRGVIIMDLLTFFVVLGGWIFSLCLHEFSHALVAYWGGDWTVREKGDLTFNPLKYTHPVYSLLLPLLFLVMGGIGLPGGAVYIETWRLRNEYWRSAMSLAGPMANLLVAFVLAFVLNTTTVGSTTLGPGLAFLAYLQIMAVVLNLIPVPPFDGYGVIGPFLPDGLRMQVAQVRGAFIWIVFLVLWFVPVAGRALFTLVSLISVVLGIPGGLISTGLQQFRVF